MFDYLEKFNRLPKELRDKVSSSGAISAIEGLEKKYGVNLAIVIMKVMAKDIAVNSLDTYFIDEFKLDRARAIELANELKEGVFFNVSEYLGIKQSLEIKNKEEKNFKRPEEEKNEEIFSRVVAGESNHILTRRPVEQKIEPGAEVKSKFDLKSVSKSEVSTPAKTGASFFFSPEDEEEIRELTKKIDGEFDNTGYDGRISKKLEEIIRRAQISFGSEQLLIRFKQIIETYLRGIRDKVEIRQALVKSFSEGGLNFDSESADKILLIAKSKDLDRVAIKSPEKIRLSGKEKGTNQVGSINIGIRDVDYDLNYLRKKQEEKSLNHEKKKIDEKDKIKELDVAHELAPPPPKLSDSSNISAQTRDKYKETTSAGNSVELRKKIAKKNSAAERTASPNLNIRRSFEPSGKKKMEDVKFVPRIMNPIDELRYMDLINFRRLDSSPVERGHKIEGKINLLEEEEYSKRMEGIQAWRKSPVNKLYLKIGQQSISEKKPIEIIVEDRKIAKQDYLSVEEFNAIMDMNKNLRF